MHEAFGEQLARFQAVCLGEGGDGVWEPTMEDIITLSESFHLCIAKLLLHVSGRTAVQEVRHKCTCAHIAKEAYCKHALFLAMHMDPTVKLSEEDDILVIYQRKAPKKRRTQKWQHFGNEEDDAYKTSAKEASGPSTARAFAQSIEA